MKEKKVWFENSRGEKLSGLMHIQENKPAILMVHGMMSWTDKHEFGLFDKVVSKLHEAGYSTLRFDFYGHGETEGDHVNVSAESYKDDLKSAIDFLVKQNISKNNINILAHSFGCVVSILLNDERISSVILNSCPLPSEENIDSVYSDANPNWKEEIKQKGYFEYSKRKTAENRMKIGTKIYEYSKTADLIKDVKKISKPVLFISAENDQFIPSEDIKKIFEAANEPKEFILVKDAKHNCENKPEELIKIVINFFKKHLK